MFCLLTNELSSSIITIDLILGQGLLMKLNLIALTFIAITLIGCSKNSQPSVLVILVDDLSFADSPCSIPNEKGQNSGIDTLCNESVRFTHAYSTSPLSVSSISSVLTGLYPYEHEVRHNGSYLRPEKITAAERFVNKGYRTAFFSGGAPVLRKTGLNQGFEVFNDFISPSQKLLYRPFKQTLSLVTKWISEVPSSKSFFAVAYAPDLIFTNTITSDESGDVRNFSYESQLEEFDSNLNTLITELKSRKLWNNMHVVVAGLNGKTSSPRSNEISPLNLHTENSQVALFIKPAGKVRDLALSWKFDKNVSLVDLGETLIEWAEGSTHKNSSEFASDSLVQTIAGKASDITQDRPILLESSWAAWRYLEKTRYAVIRGFNLWIHDAAPKSYNMLIDRFELTPLPITENIYLENSDTLKRLTAISAKPWSTRFPKNNLKYKIPFELWMRHDQNNLLQDKLTSLYSETQDHEVAGWLAYSAANNKDWKTLKQLGTRTENSLWVTAATTLLNEKSPETIAPDHCFLLLTQKKLLTSELKTCSDREFLDLLSWVRAKELDLNTDKQKNNFIRNYWQNRIFKSVARANIAMAGILDTSLSNTLRPNRTDLALQLIELKNYRVDLQIEIDILEKNIESINQED